MKVDAQLQEALTVLHKRQLWPCVSSQQSTECKQSPPLYQLRLTWSDKPTQELQTTIVQYL